MIKSATLSPPTLNGNNQFSKENILIFFNWFSFHFVIYNHKYFELGFRDDSVILYDSTHFLLQSLSVV